MKKGILCILLSLLLLAPMFASCQQEADFTETEASVYTLYTIVEESTTPEAIKQVELSLNRILFYRLGVILKLEMVTEDEYDKLIEDKFAEMEAYQLEKKNNKKENSSVASGDETSIFSRMARIFLLTNQDLISSLLKVTIIITNSPPTANSHLSIPSSTTKQRL